MQVDVGNNKILDNYRPIVTSPHLQALRDGEKTNDNPQSSGSDSSCSSQSFRAVERAGAHPHRSRHQRRHHRGSLAHSQSPGSGNSKSRHGEVVHSQPDSTVHRSGGSVRHTQRSLYATPAPASAADSATPLGQKVGVSPSPHLVRDSRPAAPALPPLSVARDSTPHMIGVRASGTSAQAGVADPLAAQPRSGHGRRIDSGNRRGSSQNADNASDDGAHARGVENKERPPVAAAAAAGEDGKPAKPKLAQTNVQPGMQLKHWVVVSRIGAGSFGETFAAVEVSWAAPPPSEDGFLVISPEAAALLENLPPPEQRTEVCIKVEQENKNVLRLEALALKKVQPCKQVVRYLGSGCTCGMNFLVMEKLGNNLAELRRRSPHGTFNIYTTLRAGVSCLQAIREVHAQGLIHRDIKPSNFVTGLPGEPNWAVCYLIDFGLARRFMRSSGEIRPPRDSAGFRGTSRYASVASHMHLELGRVDDLWSLLFMLVEFATGTLPWRKYKDKEDIGRCKEESIGPHLVRNLPREFQPFLAHLQTLRYEDEPDYDYLLSLMEKAIERRGYPAGKAVDWELDPSTMEAVAAQEEMASRQAHGQRPSVADSGAAPAAVVVPPQAAAAQVGATHANANGVDYTPQPVSKRERGGSRASSSQAAEDAMSPSRAANPSRVSVSEVELGYDRRPDGTGRGRESYAEEPAVSAGQQQVAGSDGKDYSTESDPDELKDDRRRGARGTDFSPREASTSKTARDDSRHLPASPAADIRGRPLDVDDAYVSPESALANEAKAAAATAGQSAPGAQPGAPAGNTSDGKRKKSKSKCNCTVM